METEKVKYLIVGAGPAGLQMGFFLKEAGLDYLIVEKNESSGSFFAQFPIHRKLISINKKYNYFEEEEFNFRHDWNSLLSDNKELRFGNYTDELFPSADLLCTYLKDYAEKLGLNIRYNTAVSMISKNENGQFEVKTQDGNQFLCEVLLIGTGPVSQNMPEEIEGIEHTTPYRNISLDLEKYKNKRVGILGGGNSGFETADYLAGTAAHVHVFVKKELKFAWQTHFVGHLRAVNNNLLDMFQLKSLHAVLNPRIRKIHKLEDGTLQTQHEYDYPDSSVPGTLKLTRDYDYIINCTGFKYANLSIFDNAIKPETKMNDKFYELNENWESKNVKNLYFIGTLMQGIDRKASSGFIHGFRYNIRTLSRLLQQFHENDPYPVERIQLYALENFLSLLYQRFSISAGLFQLFGFLGDMLVYNEENKEMEWYKELPVGYIHKIKLYDKHVFLLTLEFGFDKHKKPAIEFLGPSDPNNTSLTAFLHPVIRHCYLGQITEFHFGDSLLGRWDMPHASGGAVASYHLEFYNWLAGIIGFEKKCIDPEAENPSYAKWEVN
jgi:thioredoxin reductase